MRYMLMLLIVVVATACSPRTQNVAEEDFAVAVHVPEKIWHVNEEIPITAELTNLSKNKISIMHAAPLIQVYRYDSANNLLDGVLHRDDIGLVFQLKPNEPYNPDNTIYTDNRRTLKFDTAGEYTIVGTATLWVDVSDDERKEFNISSLPIKIKIHP